jgi:hypothetical protein
MMMKHRQWLRLLFVGLACTGLIALAGRSPAADSLLPKVVEFNRDIRPILADNCYACHGPDKNARKADLRLDNEEGATADRGGYRPLVAGKPEQSELYRRVTNPDVKKRMPPAKFGKRPTPRQVELLRQWIAQGGQWQKHWSLIAPRRAELPKVANAAWPCNPIDYFILARLEQEGLEPSPEADKHTLIRRLSFDLTGLPPEPREVDAFLADRSPVAYERLVDRLLASKHYGERMALYWLDVVRYADTGGYHSDNHRDIYLYRDYVIAAFNNNKPFDRFTVEQLAGDLLPGATRADRIASGYNRLLMTTEEGGAQAKEYLAKYAADRVRNTSTIWLGLTLGCTQCHDHKFDPFFTKEFYRFAAFFADLKEIPVGRQEQTPLPTPDEIKQFQKLDEQIASVRAALDKQTPTLDAALAKWAQQKRTEVASALPEWAAVGPEKAASSGGATLVPQEDLSILATGSNPANDNYTVTLRTDRKHLTGIRLEALTHPSLVNNSLSRSNGNYVLTRFEVEAATPGARPQPVKMASAVADYSQNGFPIAAAIGLGTGPGWAVDGFSKRENRTAVFTFARPLAGGPGTVLTVRLKHESVYAHHNIGRFRLALTSADKPGLSGQGGLPDGVSEALTADAAKRTPAQKEALARYYRGIAPELEPLRLELADLQRRKDEVGKLVPTSLVSMAVEPRVMRVLPRGNWLDDSGDVVTPGVPASLAPLAVKDRRANRLDLAKWMVAPDNPLVARVFVNRLWKLMFGQGIVKTLDDFGAQGAWPTHQELLDWLAVEFRESGWDVKHLLKIMVLSAAYRQASFAGEKLRQRDPYNQLLARQARFRLDAEMVRDNALAVSGLLVRKVGGPSVKPYQPAGYWAYLNFPLRDYYPDKGPDQYRRGLYTYWQRTFPHPSLLAFDAPSREECTVDRPRSNTPLQALVLLNDPSYVEAARALAERLLHEGGKSSEERIHFAYRQVLGRRARPEETKLLASLHEQHRKQYHSDKSAAAALLSVGERPAPKDVEIAELAAWTSVARVILNLHETITRN